MAEPGHLYFEEHGPKDGPALILSSGMGGSARYWAANIPALAAEHRVIAYDHRGTGRSDRTVTPDIRSIGHDIAGLMDALEIEQASIIGHAIGGMGALTLALDAPGRVEKLVVVNGWGMSDPYTLRCFNARLALLRHVGVREYVHAQPIFLYPPQWTSEHETELDEEEDAQVEGFPAQMIEARILEAVRFCLCEDCETRPLTAPALFLASADDALVPAACSDWLADKFRGTARATMKWGGHACNVTDPETFNRLVLEFLRS